MRPRTISAVYTLLALALTAWGSAARADEATEHRNKAAVQASFDAWKAGTGSPFELVADDASWTITGHSLVAKTYASKAALMNEVIKPFNARMSAGIKPTVRQIYTDADTVIILFDASGTARDGKPYSNTYSWFFEMKNGKAVKVVAFFDSVEFNDLWRRVTPAAAPAK